MAEDWLNHESEWHVIVLQPIALRLVPTGRREGDAMKRHQTYQQVTHRLAVALFDSDLMGLQFVLALAEATWASLLLWPDPTFVRGEYRMMRDLAPEWVWAAAFLVMAIARVASWSEHTNRFSSGAALVSAAVWIAAVGAIVWIETPPPAVDMAPGIALACAAFWVAVRPIVLWRMWRKAVNRAR